ncbi:hypothetical protein E0Z10_g2954 [Xylaria hypoxylon]|uniref:N-acetyltransferase domain-containing protein n=1 Tax=Xylaria hypoxylon TaxID=37992 RepID=A0A4Z0ZB01_9PEZI|nr:hypothetical protein E0Z10_g2954 [Xylaria hypoxylon]
MDIAVPTPTHEAANSTLAPSRHNDDDNTTAKIEVPPSSAADDEQLTEALTGLVNVVYSEAEHGIYSTDFERTSGDDVADLLRAGELAVAYLPRPDGDKDDVRTGSFHQTRGTPIGCISMKKISSTAGEFGMLAVDPKHRDGGVGGSLVRFAEEWCCRHLGLSAMRLELLAPVHFKHVGKTRLQAWYERLGYVRVELRDFQKAYPRLYELLSGPTEFRVFEKKLVDRERQAD